MFVINLFTLLLSKKFMMSQSKQDRVTIKVLEEMKSNNEKISMLTSYDYSFAKIIDSAGIDIILVGDSASNVMAGHETTLPITLDQMIYHASSVVRAVKRALVVVDLPFGTYQADSKVALKSAIRIMKESGAHAVKLEGGKLVKDSIERILKAGIPVMGHLGLVPRKSTWIGGLRAVGKTANEAYELYQKFKRLENAGAFSAECEVIPENVMGEISKRTDIVTVSLGSGKNADVMYLFMEDICGDTENPPRHSKAYGNLLRLRNEIKLERVKALKAFKKDSMNGKFPGKKQSSNLEKKQFEEFINQLD